MHLKRWLTGIVAIPVLVYIIGPGPRWLFHAFVLLASIVGLSEFFSIAVPRIPKLIRIANFILAFFLFYFVSRGPFFMTLPTISLWLIVPFVLYLFLYRSHSGHVVEDIGKTVLGLVYICLPLALLIFIDRHPRGNVWIFYLLSVIFLCDTGAFYFGRFFGKHKLYPSVSPGKTWEGAIGGFLCGFIPAFAFPHFVSLYKLNLRILAFTLGISIFCQIGDLAESMLKRSYGVKDSGNILPGHGGLLDRIDGLLFSIPILYIFLTWSV
jgi:phosphatidate cytidylyltransferase